ncbi:unnamed protein product [Urochloa humidicola]
MKDRTPCTSRHGVTASASSRCCWKGAPTAPLCEMAEEEPSSMHVAAQEECDAVVAYVCGTPQYSSILNAQDKNGDTALHRAVHAGNLPVSNCLVRNRQVRLDVANADGMTPLDLSISMIPLEFRYQFNPRRVIWMSLALARAPARWRPV